MLDRVKDADLLFFVGDIKKGSLQPFVLEAKRYINFKTRRYSLMVDTIEYTHSVLTETWLVSGEAGSDGVLTI